MHLILKKYSFSRPSGSASATDDVICTYKDTIVSPLFSEIVIV